jgi:hypothetical protein
MSTLHKEFPPLPEKELDEKTKRATILFKKIVVEAHKDNWKYVILSGFAIDIHLGYFSRNHKDVDFLIDKSNIDDVKSFLQKQGHAVYESDKYGKDLLRVDPTIIDGQIRLADCDIHIGFFDENTNEVVLPMNRGEIRFPGSYEQITVQKEFLGVQSKILKLPLLVREREGWKEKIGLTGREERNELENQKVQKIISIISKQ